MTAGGVGYSEQTAAKGGLKPGMPNHRDPLCRVRQQAQHRQAPQGCSGSRDDLEVKT